MCYPTTCIGMSVRERIGIRVDWHDAGDLRFGGGCADGDLERLQGKGAVFGAGVL